MSVRLYVQFLLQNMKGGVFQSGTIITKNNKRIVQKVSDNSVLEPQSQKVKLLQSQKVAWRCDIR